MYFCIYLSPACTPMHLVPMLLLTLTVACWSSEDVRHLLFLQACTSFHLRCRTNHACKCPVRGITLLCSISLQLAGVAGWVQAAVTGDSHMIIHGFFLFLFKSAKNDWFRLHSQEKTEKCSFTGLLFWCVPCSQQHRAPLTTFS